MAAAALSRIFGGSGDDGEVPSPRTAIQKLRETEVILGKKSEFLEKKIEEEMAAAKRAGMKNKRGVFVCVVCVVKREIPYSWKLSREKTFANW